MTKPTTIDAILSTIGMDMLTVDVLMDVLLLE
jgi:hypothetical protein